MRAKKSLGQNFLKSKRVLDDMVRAAEIVPGDTVLEIGPGRGALTRALLDAGARVVAVEKDAELMPVLSEMFSRELASKQLELLHGDILEWNPNQKLAPRTWKLVANIPYYITGEIIRRFLSEVAQPERMVILVQKEVAERIMARNGKESILSLSVKAFGTPRKVANVPAKYFSPAPDVDSAIIAITDISHDRLPANLEQRFFELIKKAFGQKRKQLAGTLPPLVSKETLVDFLSQRNIPGTVRPEELSFDDWRVLTERPFA